MLSDEEKEALEILKSFEPDDLVECAIYLQALEKITDLIEKQQKEIEELKEGFKIQEHNYQVAMEEIEQSWEDKTKTKIEELQDDIKYSANPLSIDNSKFGIKVLQSLLEKE